MDQYNFYHVDVFANAPLTGNGLTVFLNTDAWSGEYMQRLTQEMRQFESIFLSNIQAESADARIFTGEEELPFAGHPVLGAAAILHRILAPQSMRGEWTLQLQHSAIKVRTQRLGLYFSCEMNQGVATLGPHLSLDQVEPVLERLSLTKNDVISHLPPQVISTGLNYLILPVTPEALARTKIRANDLEKELGQLAAKFVFVLDPDGKELRTWDNYGLIEDIATGSAAGPAIAYLVEHGLAQREQILSLSQGRFLGRPSQLHTQVNASNEVLVSGEVWPVSKGKLEIDQG